MATNNYSKFDEVMRELLGGENGTTIQNFNASVLQDFANHSDVFWDGLLQFLQHENEKGESRINSLNEYGIRESDFSSVENIETIVEYINNNADLIDTFLDECLKEKDRSQHWNESFDKLLEVYWSYFVDQGKIDSTNITVKDLVEANAGYSFDNTKEERWVVPWHNINNDTYAEVRNNDKIVRILNDDKYLQFTHNLFTKYIRLLMPEYKRVVEVEDLDRNFWVIGQVLTGILAFLFDQDSPIKQLIDGSLDEITQLWENIFYLWIALAITSQLNKYKTIEPIVVPISNDEICPYVKFDNFDFDDTQYDFNGLMTYLWEERLSHLPSIYQESTLVIIPEIREENYGNNYYSKVYYPGVIVYNRRLRSSLFMLEDASAPDLTATNDALEEIEDAEVDFYQFKINNKDFIIDMKDKNNKVMISGIDWTGKICGVYEKTPYYYYTKNFNSLGTKDIYGGEYVGAIRTIFNKALLVFSNDSQTYSLQIEVQCNDVAAELCNKTVRSCLAATFVKNHSSNTLTSAYSSVPSAATIGVTSELIENGYYRGEVASWGNYHAPSFNITLRKVWENVPQNKNYQAKIKVTSIDSFNQVRKTQEKTFTHSTTDNPNLTQNQTISVLSVDNQGGLYTHKIEESEIPEGTWEIDKSNTVININSASKITTFTNKWAGVEFNGEIKAVSKTYGNESGHSDITPGTQTYANVGEFLDALSQETEINNWKNYVKEDAESSSSPLGNNQARFYCARYTYHYHENGDYGSQIEVLPYLTLVTNVNNRYSYYSFEFKIAGDIQSGGVHSGGNNKIKYPYVSSMIYQTPATQYLSYSTKYLCRWSNQDNALPDTNNGKYYVYKNVLADDPNAPTKGNISYCDWGRQNGSDDKTWFMKINYNNGNIEMHNFIVKVMDRCCLNITNRSNVNDSIPYYYKCKLTKPISIDGAGNFSIGEITATIQYNNSKNGTDFKSATKDGYGIYEYGSQNSNDWLYYTSLTSDPGANERPQIYDFCSQFTSFLDESYSIFA